MALLSMVSGTILLATLRRFPGPASSPAKH
jgi:hypothetical protein